MKQTLSLALTLFLAHSFCLENLRAAPAEKDADKARRPVSYYRDIRPVFQAQCQGCHQPAKDKGGYVMTDFQKLLGTGDSGKKSIVPGKPDQSYLISQITPKDGSAEMPKDKPALLKTDLELIQKWIAEGAKDDTPANARQRIDAEHPPVYQNPPVITSLHYSPDGSILAVAGFHEVLLHKGDGSKLLGRLVGLSERIESVRFSPDGKFLAVAGGLPARMGEIQIWDLAKRKLTLSVPVTYDTVYGVNWSPDGKLVSFGCSDNTVRAIEVATGKQVLQQGSHNDWVLDTVFSLKGDHIISAGRDMSAKLTEVATQRFVDNITSITPGALRGGLHSVVRHPEKDEILIGGADGIPAIYRVFRKTARKIGDNANLIRKFPVMDGRIYSVDYSADGNRIVAGSSLDGTGMVNVYSAQFDSNLSTNLVKILEKTVGEQSKEEKETLEKYVTSEVKLLAHTELKTAVYTVSFSPDGSTIAEAGEDGRVRFLNPADGKIIKEFIPVPLKGKQWANKSSSNPVSIEQAKR